MDTPDNGTRYLIHKIGTRRINLRGTGMRMTAPAPLWWSSTHATWVAQGYDVLTVSERDQTTLPDNGEWVETYAEVPTNIGAMPICVECGRVFNLLDDDDASEFHYGHDCEKRAEQ